MTSRPVVVHPDPSEAGHRALRWAAAEADRRSSVLQLAPARGSAHDALRKLSADAAVVVVPATLTDVTAVVASSYCPVVVAPAEPPSPGADAGPVALAAAPWTGEDVIDAAFEEAWRPVGALHCSWSEPGISLGRLQPGPIADWDRPQERARRELELAISPWRIVHPGVDVRCIAVQDDAAELLLARSHRAPLLVLGRSTRGALLAGLSESPVTALLRTAHCPVLIVPPEGPPRTTWLPDRASRWASSLR
ncbi:universal stress protein [Pseudonocardia zijingensis]|uniref:universal stress protein n=1 Tax=Pseudonocardia zijingensis TaxID=153376 RepID=UPI0031DE62C2